MSGRLNRSKLTGFTNGVVPTPESGFPHALYGTAIGYWESIDATATPTVANRIVGGPGLTAVGTPTVNATGWNGTQKSIDFDLASTDLLSADFGSTITTTPIVVWIFDQVSAPNAGLQVIGAWNTLGGNDLHLWNGPATNNTNCEQSGTGNVNGAAAITGRQIWISQKGSATNVTTYRNGTSILSLTIGAGITSLRFLNIGNHGFGIGPNRAFGGRWRASFVFTSLSATPAALNAALELYYNV